MSDTMTSEEFIDTTGIVNTRNTSNTTNTIATRDTANTSYIANIIENRNMVDAGSAAARLTRLLVLDVLTELG